MVRRAPATVAVLSTIWLIVLAAGARVAFAHPLHTTLVQLTYDQRAHRLEGSIRVFAGDLAAAIARRSGAGAPNDDRVSDAAAFAYVSRTVSVTDDRGRAILLAWCGSRREGDVLWLCVRASTPAPGMLRLSDQMLCDLFDDQVNIVQFIVDGRRSSMLFTKGDGAKHAT